MEGFKLAVCSVMAFSLKIHFDHLPTWCYDTGGFIHSNAMEAWHAF